MEKNLDKTLDDIASSDGVTGCLVSDKQGLCLGVRGNVNPESSGILTAIAERAKKLDPTLDKGAIVVLENNEKQCIIQSNDKLVISLYKNAIGSG